MLLQAIRTSRATKGGALLLSLLLLQPYFIGLKLYAGTGGPTQPEYSAYTAVGNSDFVDPFTGNVQYQVPLFEIGGYPVALSYSGDLNPEQDAGWVGLGWSLNLGSINRALRGVPDDFDGDTVEVKRNNKPHTTTKVTFNRLKAEVLGLAQESKFSKYADGVKKRNSYNVSVLFDNYTGMGIGFGSHWSLTPVDSEFNLDTSDQEFFRRIIKKHPEFLESSDDTVKARSYGIQMGVDYNSKSRTSMSMSFFRVPKDNKFSLLKNAEMSYNSRASQADLGYSMGYTNSNAAFAYSTFFGRAFSMQVPPPQTREKTYTVSLDLSKKGLNGQGFKQKRNYSVIATISTEQLVNKTDNKLAYGYFNLKGNNHPEGSIIDVEEFPNSMDTKMDKEKYGRQLTPATKTYDVFNISAAGVGGSFRAHQNSVIMYGPSTVEKKPFVNNLYLKGEFGKSELGFDAGLGLNKSYYGKITQDKLPLVDKLKYKTETVNNDYQEITFKNDYEFIETDLTFYNKLGGTSEVTPVISDKFGNFADYFNDKDGNNKVQLDGGVNKSQRDAKQQVIICNKAIVASQKSFFKKIENYWFDKNGNPQIDGAKRPLHTSNGDLNRVSGMRKAHHISEIEVMQPDGSRYFFSTPVYSILSKEVTFDASEINSSNFNYLNGTVTYNQSDIKAEAKGTDARFYESKKVKGYATTFLLNAVISADYVDVDDNGPSENDIGEYVKFNYGLMKSNVNSDDGTNSDHYYKWRTPSEPNTAFFSKGFYSDKLDQKAYYSYGEKELWYAHSIETKDQIAFFYLKPRLDGWEVFSENGGINNTGITQQYLQQIVLFSKKEFYKNGFNAEPLKTVNFDYSYDLCGNYNQFSLLSNGATSSHPLYSSLTKEDHKGKLTLHKIWFTYGKMGVNTSAAYVFEYNNDNPDFSYKSVDRWGNYLPANYYSAGKSSNDQSLISTADYPFTPQDDKVNQDKRSSVWMLSDITLPSGGKVKFEYESDDYAYVQDKKAMRTLPIEGWNKSKTLAGIEERTFGAHKGNNKNYYLIFKKVNGQDPNSYYLANDLVYYSMNVKISPENNDAYEQVSGFFEVDEIGTTTDNSDYGYIKVKPEKAGMFNAHPVTRMALQYGLSNVPFNLYPGSDLRRSNPSVTHIADMMFGILPDLMGMVNGKYQYFQRIGACQVIDKKKSYIRIPETDGSKMGGGHRVKKVTLSDNWDKMTQGKEQASNYTIVYDYTTNENGVIISSGVASNEPNVGADENPLKVPINADAIKSMRKKMYKPIISYELGPIGEEFYSSPSVGYSRVTIRNEYPNSAIVRHRTGYTLKEFYTAKDYPSYSSSTKLQLEKLKFGTPNLSGALGDSTQSGKKVQLGLDISVAFSYLSATQGISVETNDMHGKLKSDLVYQEDALEPISGQRIYYKESEKGRLSNEITVLRPNSTVAKTTSGLNVETTIYGSEIKESSQNFRPNVNIDNTNPAILVTVMPGYTLTKERTRVVTTTKHITRTGIVDSVVVFDKGASTCTKNLAWDALTGQVLLSSIQNEYGDNIYTLVKPAHWMYKGMSGAYKNANALVALNTLAGIAQDSSGLLFPGDELYRDDNSSAETYYVLDKNNLGQVSVIKLDGTSVPNGYKYYRVKRSGYRNLLGNSAEVITLMSNPINSGNSTFAVDKDSVLDAKAFVYDDIRKVLPKEFYCFNTTCNRGLVNLMALDTTGFGYQRIYNNGPIFNSIPDTISLPRSQYYYGKATIENCCLTNNNIGVCYEILSNFGYQAGQIINPFSLGIRGVWNINGEYVYFEKRNSAAQRVQTLTDPNDLNTTTMRFDGRLVDYKEFWQFATNTWSPYNTQSLSNPWTWKESIFSIDNYGNPIETVNVLDIFSSQLYGYNNRRLVTAQCANTKIRNMLFDGFEDIEVDAFYRWHCRTSDSSRIDNPIYGSSWTNEFLNTYRHWPVSKLFVGGENSITDKVSHTGWKSVQLGRGKSSVPIALLDNSIVQSNTSFNSQYYLQNNEVVDRFSPEESKDYYMSMWVKETYSGQFDVQLLTDSGGKVANELIPLTSINSNTVVDGWRQVSFKFTIAAGKRLSAISFINKAPDSEKLQYCYLDDLRITPMQSSMQSYVYDYNRLRVMATLDDNNFATFYEYDLEGRLVRKKVETAKGIMTVSENRQSNRK